MKIKSREAILEKEVTITVLSTLLSSTYILSRQPIEETKNKVLGMSLLRTQHFLGLFHLKWSVIPGIHQTIKPETPLCTLEIYSIRREHIAEEKNITGQLSRYRRQGYVPSSTQFTVSLRQKSPFQWHWQKCVCFNHVKASWNYEQGRGARQGFWSAEKTSIQ